MMGEDITFGVEFECVFAFHQSLLENHLRSAGDDSRIIKELSADARIAFRRCAPHYFSSRRRYEGWALTGKLPDPSGDFANPVEHRLQTYGYRPYVDEISHVARSILPQPTAVHSITYYGDRESFSEWHVCDDMTVMGATDAVLQANLRDRIDNVDNWDSHCVELVTRVLPVNEKSFAEIGDYLSALRGNPSSLYGAFPTDQCGLHVHVGLPTPLEYTPGSPLPAFSLVTLQHLAYILVMYEREISALHPASRREGSTASEMDIQSNLLSFVMEYEATLQGENFDNFDDENFDPEAFLNEPFSYAEHSYVETTSIDSLSDAPSLESFPLDFARKLIFSPSQTYTSLVDLMNPNEKLHMVSFQKFKKSASETRTIEFRQHQGCLDAEGTKWWVLFCVGLVRLAREMGEKHGGLLEENENEGWDGEGYGTGSSMDELLELMEFDKEGQEYFRRKRSSFALQE